MLWASILGLFLTGCGGSQDDTPTCTTDADVDVAVIRTITFARADGDVCTGFDLDGEVTELGDSSCGGVDYVDPYGNPGIDSALAGLMPVLDSTEAVALEPIIQDFINAGEILLLLEMTGRETDDASCQGFRLLRGSGAPLVGTDDLLLEGQTLEVDTTAQSEFVSAQHTDDGAFLAAGFGFQLPIVVFDADLDLVFEDAVVRIEEQEDGTFSGWLGGGVPYQGLVDSLLDTNIDSELKELLPTAVEALADLDPDGDGECQNLSVTLEFDAVRGYVYDAE